MTAILFRGLAKGKARVASIWESVKWRAFNLFFNEQKQMMEV